MPLYIQKEWPCYVVYKFVCDVASYSTTFMHSKIYNLFFHAYEFAPFWGILEIDLKFT